MVGPLDSKNPPAAFAAGALPDPPDLPLQPDVDSLSTFVPEHAPLERSDSPPPSALTHAEPTRVDIPPETYIVWPVADDDRSWWSRLRSLKTSWETKRLWRSAHDETVTTDAAVSGPAARTSDVTMAAIEARLGRTEDTIHRRDDIVAGWLEEVSALLTARLQTTEETIQRIERERVDETLRLTQQSIADSRLPAMCANIERQLVEARLVIERIEEAVADRRLHELCKDIDARLERTEDTLHRHEGVVTEWLQELSADMTARFAEAEEAIQRIERIVSSRIVEQAPSQQPSVRTDGGVLARAALFLSRVVNIEYMNRPLRQPWVARLAVPVLIVVAVVAIGTLITSNRGLIPDKVVPLTTGDQISTPTEQATNQVTRAASTTVLLPDVPQSGGETPGRALQERPPDRKSAPATSRSPRFVGTLSITSVPSGASVSINGKPAGRTPLRLPRQRAGSLAVQVAHDGFERWSAAVLVPADQLTQVNAKLRASAR